MSRPDQYPTSRSPPAGQGHRSSYSPSRHDDRNDRGRPERQRQQQQQPQDQPYFEPPPTTAYDDQYIPYEQHPQQSDHFPDYANYGAAPSDTRPQQHRPTPTEYFDRAYAPSSDPSSQSHQQVDPNSAMTPYDDEKAEAEWRRGVEEAYTYQRPEPPPTAYTEREAYEDDLMREQRERERDLDRIEWERERDRRYFEERSRQRDRSRDRERRRKRDEDSIREKVTGYPSDPKKGGRDVFGSSEGERGLAAKLAGGAGGAWIAHEVTDNALGTLGGLIVGAIAANTLEKQVEKRQNRKLYGNRRDSGDRYAKANKYGEVAYPVPGRDMDDVRRTGRDGSRDEVRERDRRARRRSQSFVSSVKDRVRSLSRRKAPSRPQASRRRSSYDSYDSYGTTEESRRR
ncbi:hypothetical protein DOTSEDRAFT_69077 [Dothistroma septosporum NZE10]|uniref:Glycine zipper 2TM domain-containing protein n=1 Tax=Dothistroma septosporum (strain NZE10 / CBS 128990) TaxID=675120 RepID=N1PU32_DOTSN|nr:hypothetical protein DOTSEDRAFT_69077 [Dothistroma septosporum NZE10]